MLLELEVKDFALIDHLSIQFQKGFNILTGETGAGKSIIIDAVNMAIGERADREYVRTGAKKAVIQVSFNIENTKDLVAVLNEHQIDLDDEKILFITREIYSNGRSISRVNGVIVNQGILKSITEKLIDIHGQHQHQSLLNPDFHIDFLDVYGGKEISDLLKVYLKDYHQYLSLRKELDALSYNEMERERKIDLIKFQLEEIDSAQLEIGEEEELDQQKLLLSNAEKIYTTLSSIYENLYSSNYQPSVLENISIATKSLSSISSLDKNLNHFYSSLENIHYTLEDLTTGIRNYKEQIDFSPQVLEQVEKRLDTIHNLKRKYGSTIEEILSYRNSIENELDNYINNEEKIMKLKKQLNEIIMKLQQSAIKLSELRRKTAKLFETNIVQLLDELNMKNVLFSVFIEQQKDAEGQFKLTPKGIDKVEFMISTNKGEPLKPLAKIASGGEISRIMLALKTILADVDQIPILIFDEIDTGISGITAQVVSEKLHHISLKHQVICITHLPQIAAMADTHFLIHKLTKNNGTKTIVKELDKENRLYEIGRLLDGEATDLALKHAEEMIDKAIKRKKAH